MSRAKCLDCAVILFSNPMNIIDIGFFLDFVEIEHCYNEFRCLYRPIYGKSYKAFLTHENVVHEHLE